MYYVYIYYRLDTNEPFYVGKGKGDRWEVLYNRNEYFKNIINKYDVATEMVANDLIEYEALGIEIWLIHELVFEHGLTLIGQGHAKVQSKLAKKSNNEAEIDYIIPSLAKRGYKIVSTMVDNIFYVDIDVNEEGKEMKVVRTRATREHFVGSRFKFLPDTMLLDADTIVNELHKTIDKEG